MLRPIFHFVGRAREQQMPCESVIAISSNAGVTAVEPVAGIDSRHSFRHSSESWNPEGVGRGKTTRRWEKPAHHPIFILLCGLRKAMVIPAFAGIQRR